MATKFTRLISGASNTGGEYSSVTLWEANEAGLHVDGEDHVLQCDAFKSDENGIEISDWANSSSPFTITIEAYSGAEHNGQKGTGFILTNGGGSAGSHSVIRQGANIPNLVLRQIELLSETTAEVFWPPNLSAGATLVFDGVIVSDTGLVSSGFYLLYANDINYSSVLFRNCFIQSIQASALTVWNGDPFAVENTTIISGNVGLKGPFTDASCVNVAVDAVNNCFESMAGPESKNNAANDGTAPGLDSIQDLSSADGVDFVSPSTGDYNPQPNGKLDGAGTSPPIVATDIAGNSRNDPDDIGVYAIVGAAPGVTFDGPDIVAQTGIEEQVFSFNENGEGTVASRFTGATTYALSPLSDPLPTGLSVNATTGNIEGTPAAASAGTYTNIIIRGSDT